MLTADGWYRTGDLVRIDEDGYVHVVGRLTDMIIRGGANVSPAEVEAVLVRHADVREAAVVGRRRTPTYGAGGGGGRRRSSRGSDAIDGPRCGRTAPAQLAGYKVPTRFVVVRQLPRNAHTGKVQRTRGGGTAARSRDVAGWVR